MLMAAHTLALEQDAPMRSHRRDPHDASRAFHAQATLHHLPALQQDASAGRWQTSGPLGDTDLWFIAGKRRPERTKLPVSVRVIARLLAVSLAVLLVVGVQGFVLRAARDCADSLRAQACFALSIFSAMSEAQMLASPTPRPAPAIPAVPNDVPQNVHDFLVIALPYAVQAHQALAWPTSVILAQWGLEHGWRVPDYTGYNWGNTSYAPGCSLIGGVNAPGSPAHFCYAPNPAEGLREFVYTARLSYYTGVAPAAAQGGADAAAMALGRSPWDAGHYTNIGQPGSSLIAIMRDFNFYRFDR